ncbi:MAG: carotenoid oxygenase [Gammaproteobacteria bacterium]|nr:MAG: carotenoid oxygenase [Gammaproteobacteria bacterium]
MIDRYLAHNFAPVDREITETSLDVIGTLPEELSGRYLRNGPNPVGAVDKDRHHWFTGAGMVHGVRLEQGRACWYRNRWVRNSETIKALGEIPSDAPVSGVNNTHVIGHAGRTWALVEAGTPPVELGYELDTVGVNTFFGTLSDRAFTAHPKIDPDTGDLHAVAYHWPDFGDHVQYVHVGRDGRVQRTVNVPVPGMPMIHDSSLTEHYVVLFDLPVTVSFDLLGRGMRFPFAWNADYAPRVGLLPRNGEAMDVIWCDVNPCYVFHPMNAYEDGDGNVVIDLCRYERMFQRDVQGPFGDSLATLDRWTVNPRTRVVSETRIDERAQEFPRCHPGRNGKPYRYGYSVAVEADTFPAINKIDVHTGVVTRVDIGPGRHAGEPYFVPRAGAEDEDDGYLLNYVYDQSRDASELMVLDARTPAEGPIARVLLPARVPYGFHGSWVPDGYDGPSV